MPQDQRTPEALNRLALLATGEVEIEGRMPWSSNATFLARLTDGRGEAMRAIYKPVRGERELWDFPTGLHRREVAAYVLSEALGWRLVPETLVRSDAPLGIGSLQTFLDAEYDEHYFTLLDDGGHEDRLKAICTFDLLANNADRKGGHCLLDTQGEVWAIDHGVCFHEDPKLRTVIWDFAGEPIPTPLLDDVARLVGEPPAFDDLLDRGEITAFTRRAQAVVRTGRFPNPDPDRRPYPWPLV